MLELAPLLASGVIDQLADKLIQGGSALLIASIAWFARGAFITLKSAHGKLDHLDECMDKVRISSEADRAAALHHRAEAEARDRKIAELEKDYAALAGWVKGMAGKPMETPISGVTQAQIAAPNGNRTESPHA